MAKGIGEHGLENERRTSIWIVASQDIAPTILELVGIPQLSSFKGTSLTDFDTSRIIYQETSAPIELAKQLDRIIASPQAGQSQIRRNTVPALKEAIIYSNWKYTVDNTNNARELYDLESDPKEQRNLIGTNEPQERRLKEAYESLRRK